MQRCGEMWRDVERCGEMRRDAERCGEDAKMGRCEEMWRDVAKMRRWEDAERFGDAWWPKLEMQRLYPAPKHRT